MEELGSLFWMKKPIWLIVFDARIAGEVWNGTQKTHWWSCLQSSCSVTKSWRAGSHDWITSYFCKPWRSNILGFNFTSALFPCNIIVFLFLFPHAHRLQCTKGCTKRNTNFAHLIPTLQMQLQVFHLILLMFYYMFGISILKFSVTVFSRTGRWMLLLKLLLIKLQSAITVQVPRHASKTVPF